MTGETILKVRQLTKSYKGRKVVDKISFDVQRGDIYGFLGPNGAGKTTTIRMMLGLIHPHQGTIAINGFNIQTDFKKAIERVGAIVEKPCFHEYLTAAENLIQMTRLHPEIKPRRVQEVLEIVGLKDRSLDKVKHYSLGMKQRLGIAAALVNNPALIFLDEPTNGLDPQGVIEIRKLIRSLAQDQGITFFITTHVLHEVEQICNRVAILQKGRLIAQGDVSSLLNQEKETLQIYTDDPQQALHVIQNRVKTVRQEMTDYGLRLETDKGLSARLNHLLVTEGIAVNYLIPEHRSLEQIFIELTGGNQDVESHS